MANIVYVLTNEAMPGLVKIGRTTDDVQTRITSLSSTGVPLPFECHFAVDVGDRDSAKLEKTLHQLFGEMRVNPKREFFRVDPEKVVLALSIGDFTEVTPGVGVVVFEEADQQALNKAKKRRSRIRMDAIGLKLGDVLTFSRDESIEARVTSDNRVELDGQTLSLSAAASQTLSKLGYTTTSVSGSEYWMYDGETLDERRVRMEAEQFGESASQPD